MEAVKMEKKKELSDFDKGQIEMARRLGLSVSRTASLVGCSKRTVISNFQKGRKDVQPVISVKLQQRNGRKTLTNIQGIPDEHDKKKLVQAFKEKFACDGSVVEHPIFGEMIQLPGDQRKNACQFLVEIGLAKDDQLNVVES
ncbi:eukaryotic translation initiation factor 1 [Pelobates cultripes]|uniref:Eukaryotic translation initiation factor 1 n=1 Tax=Pelobates cultripes TaxID=61616 RepID=A0AAD1SL32_PELCU|nr:eukaryotic translation initiation factor 1 [Pelobates cultripes]